MMHHEVKIAEAGLGLWQPRWYIYPQVSMHCPRYACCVAVAGAFLYFSQPSFARLNHSNLRDFLAFLILYLKVFEECALVKTRQKPSMELLMGLPQGSAYPLEEPFVIASEDEVMKTGAAIVDTVEL